MNSRNARLRRYRWAMLPVLGLAAILLLHCGQSSEDIDEGSPESQPEASPSQSVDPLAERTDIANYERINDMVVAAGQPEPAAWRAIREAGITTVINLRTEEEGALDEAPLVEEAGMTYVNVPVDSSGFDVEKFTAVGRAVDEAGGQVMIHCASSNRVGAYWYLRLVAEGAVAEDAMAEAERAGLRSETLRDQVLALAEEVAAPDPSSNNP